MNRITLTIHLDVPDGMVPDVDYVTKAALIDDISGMPSDEPPPPLEPPVDLMTQARQIFDQPPAAPVCPQGHGPMKFVPAGVSKRNGKSYDAFWGCQNRDCKQTAKAA